MATLKNNKFTVEFDESVGGISGITVKGDKMQWIKQGYVFGIPRDLREKEWRNFGFTLADFSCTQDKAVAVFRAEDFEVKTVYSFNAEGNIVVRNEIANRKDVEAFLLKGQMGFNVCFYDDYKDSLTCVNSRCHTHIQCGGDMSYICLFKMGGGKINLGIKTLKGGFSAYEQLDCKSNDRGYFIVYPDVNEISPDKPYVLEYEIFVHKGRADFIKQLKNTDGYPYIEFEENTLFRGEKCRILSNFEIAGISDRGTPAVFKSVKTNKGYKTTLSVKGLGEHKLEITGVNGKKVFAFVNVILPFKELVEKRVDFIIRKQQYHKKGSPLDGAFLIYDAAEDKPFFSTIDPDLNATRERLATGLLVAKYLRNHDNPEYLAAFKKYTDFILREIFDEKTGEVFSTVRRYSERKRLYNGPVFARLMLETYYVFKDKEYLYNMLKSINFYYDNGGDNFYPNGIVMCEMLDGLKDAKMEKEYEELKAKFLIHVGNVVKRGLNYPAHEVNFEQTIVSPAVSFITDAFVMTGDKNYLKELKPHLELLERFDGFQPNYKQNGIPIRFWDDYYAGSYATMTYGDTFPQQCGLLSARLYANYGKLSGDKRLYKKGLTGLKNGLCLFFPDGKASCAFIFPFRVNGRRGEYYDQFINDQDTIMFLAYDHFYK